jgi:ribosomal protein S18 acetylase RimI-like enzyme
MLPPHRIAEAADQNFVVHASWVLGSLAGSNVQAAHDLVVVDSGLPCDTFNFVCRARLDPARASLRATEAIGYFAGVRRPFSWWVGPADRPRDLGRILQNLDLDQAETELAMAADLSELNDPAPTPPGLEVRRVRTREELDDFARLNAGNWNPPDLQVLRFYELNASALLSRESPQWLYVGYLDGKAIATSEATIGGGVAGLYNISTLEPYRRRGIGSALTRRPLEDARAAGYTTAILQAAPDGVSIYRRVGFSPFGDITEYKPRA